MLRSGKSKATMVFPGEPWAKRGVTGHTQQGQWSQVSRKGRLLGMCVQTLRVCVGVGVALSVRVYVCWMGRL